jgi:glycosyltransferase involved in cell wall biosynthesis
MSRVSVLISAYNAGKYIEEAIRSAINQRETGEVLILDDGSKDNTWELCQELARQYSQIRLFQHKGGRNRGVAAGRNRLLAESRFPYVAFLDADDYYMPQRLEIPIQILENNPDIDVVYEAYTKFYEKPELQEEWLKQNNLEKHLFIMSPAIAPEKLFEYAMLNGTRSNVAQLVARRSAYFAIPPFNEDIGSADDALALHQLIAVCRFAAGRLSEPVYMVRIHDSNTFANLPEKQIAKARSLRLSWMTRFWRWSLVHLSDEQIRLARYFVISRARETAPSIFMYRLRPNRFFSKVHYFVGLLFLPFYFPRLAPSRMYFLALAYSMLGAKLSKEICLQYKGNS